MFPPHVTGQTESETKRKRTVCAYMWLPTILLRCCDDVRIDGSMIFSSLVSSMADLGPYPSSSSTQFVKKLCTKKKEKEEVGVYRIQVTIQQ